MKHKVLVTGGTGYIGSHTAVELLQSGFDVVIADDLSNSEVSVLEGIKNITGTMPAFEQVDLCDNGKVAQLFEKHPDIQSIIHFAASKAVGESVQIPLRYYRNNLLSLINLLEQMKEGKGKYFVFSSSCTVYGQPDQLPVTELAPVKPAESPYGNTKQIGEEILRDLCRVQENVKAIALRYFNPVGAHESALIGELPLGTPNNLVPLITQTAAGWRKEIRVFGTDYNTPDGSCIRDYIHVVDLAKAHVIAMQRMINGRQKNNYEYFNLGTGNGYSVLEVIQAFEKVTGKKLNYTLADRRPGDIEQIWADTLIANRELGWKAEKDLDEMMLSAWKWQESLTKR